MNDQSQIIKLAKLDGFVRYKAELPQTHPIEEVMIPYPDYLNSRDAIVPVIEKQDWATQVNVAAHVCAIVRKQDFGEPASSRVHTMLATPSQLAEALLRACGKWEE